MCYYFWLLILKKTKKTKSIKNLVQKYNACQPLTDIKDDKKSISLAESLIPSEIQSRLKKFSSYCTIADGRKKEQVDAYFMYCRSEEEQSLLLSEATHVVTYYENRKRIILRELGVTSASDSNAYTRGMHALFTNARQCQPPFKQQQENFGNNEQA